MAYPSLAMSRADFWYIRFPDGRILRAASTSIVRQELEGGHIPLGSTARRAPGDEWTALAWTQEFADLVAQLSAAPPTARAPSRQRPGGPGDATDQPATVGSRLDPSRLNLIGVRNYLGELLAALDSTLIAKKILVGVLAGLILGGVLALQQAAWLAEDSRGHALAWSLTGVGLIVLDFLTGLLTQWTYIEVARLRPARWRDGLSGIGRLTIRLILTQILVGGAAWGLIVLLRWIPHWIDHGVDGAGSAGQHALAGIALVLAMVLEVVLWPVFFVWWLVPPILVVEEYSITRCLWQWLDLLRHRPGGVLLYQTLAVAVGVVLATPFLLVIAPVFLPSFYPPEELADVARGTRCVLFGLACTPLLTYWIVANVFVYLNLRYGASK